MFKGVSPHPNMMETSRTIPNGFTEYSNGTETPSRKWVVQKFGGTSVGKFAVQIARDIVRVALEGDHIAVVCSARSGTTKSEGTTNRLLRAAAEASNPSSREYIPIVNAIRDDHIQHAKETIKSEKIIAELSEEISTECENLIKVLESAQYLEQVEWRAQDRIISKGEKLACRFMTALLKDQGVDATYVDMSDVLKPSTTPNSIRIDATFYASLAQALGERVLACGDSVPVITGYFGNVPNGLLDTIGRGYTDLCAALVAVGVKARELQVWKEVDGIFTADPRKVPTARLLPAVTPSEAAELTFYGSEVIHPFTMEQVIRARIPIRIKNVMNPKGNGTVIYPDPVDDLTSRPATPKASRMFRTRSFRPKADLPVGPKRPTAITVKRNIVILNVHSNKRVGSSGFMKNVFAILDRWHLSHDLMSTSEVHVSIALHSESGMLSGTSDEMEIEIRDEDLLGAVKELSEFGTIDLVNDMAIVSLVGKQLKNMVGISGKFFSTLGNNNINIEMISQGASEINISCVIAGAEADRALNVLHTNLFTFLED